MSSSDQRIRNEARRHARQVSRITTRYDAEAKLLQEDYDELDEALRAEYEAKINDLRAERAAAEQTVENRRALELHEATVDRDERLNELVDHELRLMRGRGYDDQVEKGKEFRWLRDKTFDKTYRDWGPKEGRPRVRRRLTELLGLCQGDRALLLKVYTWHLNLIFPIPFKSYMWAPAIIEEKGHVTIVHRWKRTPRPIPYVGDDEEEIEQ